MCILSHFCSVERYKDRQVFSTSEKKIHATTVSTLYVQMCVQQYRRYNFLLDEFFQLIYKDVLLAIGS